MIIDHIHGKGKELQFLGWGSVSHAEGADGLPVFHALKYQVTDSEGKAVPFRFSSIHRADVNDVLKGHHADKDFGFRIQFEDTDSPSYHMICTDPVSGATLEKTVTRRKIRAQIEQDKAQEREAYIGPLSYDAWRKQRLPSEEEKERQRAHRFSYAPKISILVPMYRTPLSFLKDLIDSVQAQTYANWQLCLADGSASSFSSYAQECANEDPRILYRVLEENRGISGNTNAALHMADGDYIALLDHDDYLEDTALFELVSCLQTTRHDAVYTDEDKVDMEGSLYFDPHFKPDFSPDYLRSTNYICHLFMVRRDLANEVGGLHEAYDGSQDYDFILRCTEHAASVGHVPMALYHWRSHPGSTAENQESKLYCYEAGKRALDSHLNRLSIAGEAEMLPWLGLYHIHYVLHEKPLVSILIPNRDQAAVLRRCVHSIQSLTSYKNYEILILENNSEEPETFACYEELTRDARTRVLNWEHPFNYSAINNYGASRAKGDYLLLLNNDTEVLSENWLSELLSDAAQPGVGAAGAKLLYSDDTIQHAGVVLGLGGIAGHVGSRTPGSIPGYFGRAVVRQNISAVTGACLLISARDFQLVGGLEEDLPLAYNDIDLCLKLRKMGLRIVLNPQVQLYHHESLSRGAEDTPEKQMRLQRESQYLVEKWGDSLTGNDPYYNPNLTLSMQEEAFSLRRTEEDIKKTSDDHKGSIFTETLFLRLKGILSGNTR